MSKDRDIENKKNSMENFIEPDNNALPGSDEASVFMKKRLLQHRKYLKTARGAQQAMEKISEFFYQERSQLCALLIQINYLLKPKNHRSLRLNFHPNKAAD